MIRFTILNLKLKTFSSGRGQRFGVDPAFGRRVEVDMSEDRMKKAWQAYKVRWEQEEEQRLILEEKKLVILLTKKLAQNQI